MSRRSTAPRYRLHISPGNNKVGRCPNVSLPPLVTCADGCATTCYKPCYARRNAARFPRAAAAWAANLELWRTAPDVYRAELCHYIERHRPAMFRYHIGGDIPDVSYLDMMRHVACLFTSTKFMAFTKRYDWLLSFDPHHNGATPPNLRLIASAWPGLPIPLTRLEYAGVPVAWVAPKHKRLMSAAAEHGYRVPRSAVPCPGRCDRCGHLCWHLRPDQHVVFGEH